MDTLNNLPESNENVVVVRILPTISDKEELFDIFSRTLSFPDYFGRNWNALSDCLSDLEWLDSKSVIIIVHSEFPRLPHSELHTYLDALQIAQACWIKDGSKRLTIIFG